MKGRKNGLILKLISGLFVLLAVVIAVFAVSGYYKADLPNSFLPDYEAGSDGDFVNGSGGVMIENPWYTLSIDSAGNMNVSTKDNKSILSGMAYCANYERHNDLLILEKTSTRQISDSAVFLSGKIDNLADLTIIITASTKEPTLKFTVNTHYFDSVVVLREAMIADYDIPVTEVFLKNRKTDRDNKHKEYWLDKQGVSLGGGNRSSMIYNQHAISSIQLDSRQSRVVINLDYYLDQPFIEIPFQADGAGKWKDKSASAYKPGDEKTNEFTIIFGYLPIQTPRLMLVPNGYLSAYVFTEHADAGNMRTHRAAYFGDENITDIRMANGGFAKHEIGVTKSIYFENIDAALWDSTTLSSEIEHEYLDFLDQLYSTGFYDLCLHTPDESNSNRQYLQDAISGMRTRYNTTSWIDHGMFPGNNNREAMVADGLNPESEFYAADLWEKYGTRFFWSPAVEAIRFSKYNPSLISEFLNLNFTKISSELWRRYEYRKIYFGENSMTVLYELTKGFFPRWELNSLQPLKGSSLPTPLFWQNKTRSGALYSWTTEFVYNGLTHLNSETDVLIEKRAIDLLLFDWGVFFNHGYFVRDRIHDNFILNENNNLIINPYFDRVLEYLDNERDKGDLFLTTVKDLLNYWLLLENVRFEYKTDGTIDVFNDNDQEIQGLSIAVSRNSGMILLDGNEPVSRTIDDDLIFWFDISANSRRTISFVDHI